MDGRTGDCLAGHQSLSLHHYILPLCERLHLSHSSFSVSINFFLCLPLFLIPCTLISTTILISLSLGYLSCEQVHAVTYITGLCSDVCQRSMQCHMSQVHAVTYVTGPCSVICHRSMQCHMSKVHALSYVTGPCSDICHRSMQ